MAYKKHPNNKEELQILLKRLPPNYSIVLTPDHHITGEDVTLLNPWNMLQHPTRGHQITLLLINYVFKDSSFLKNEKDAFSLNIKIKKNTLTMLMDKRVCCLSSSWFTWYLSTEKMYIYPTRKQLKVKLESTCTSLGHFVWKFRREYLPVNEMNHLNPLKWTVSLI